MDYVNNTSYYDEFNIVEIGGDVVYQKSLMYWAPVDPASVVRSLSPYYDSFTLQHLSAQTDLVSITDMLEESSIVIIHGHGHPAFVTINEVNKIYLTNSCIYDLDDMSPNFDLSNIKIAIIAGCSTADNFFDESCCPSVDTSGNAHNCILSGCACCCNHYNLPKALQAAGVEVAIGWQISQFDNQDHEWITCFFNRLAYGDTAYQALTRTNNNFNNDSKYAVMYGNGNFVLE